MAIKRHVTEQAFQQHLQVCLQHLYDYSFLEAHELTRILLGEVVEGDRVEAVRELILQGIERLRPGAGIAFHSKAARTYNILNLRYVLQQETLDVTQQLALSNRQFYREHSKAIHMLSRLLWNFPGAQGLPPPESKSAPTGTISVESEVLRSHDKAAQSRLDLCQLLASIASDSQALGAYRQIAIDFAASGQPIWLEIDRTLLRQALLFILAALVEAATLGSTIQLNAETTAEFQRISFVVNDPSLDGQTLRASLENQDTLTMLVRTLKGRLDYEDDSGRVRLALDIPSTVTAILIIDDNPDLVNLFRRYLHDQAYALYAAEEANSAIQLARQLHPNLIILDIMLPGQDGLEILQNLKTHISTRDIPILICSVLEARGLAISLGADDFIHKPPDKASFLKTLAQWQWQE
ncbi:MAG: response regulator [Anaerolineae bacterium]|nr:response regulator [Anaerolineae bacterium]